MNHLASALLAVGLLFIPHQALSAGQGADPRSAQHPVSGLVTDVMGQPVAVSAASQTDARALSPGDRVLAGDVLRTGRDDRVEIVWDRRAFLAVPERTELTIQEQQVGRTDVLLKEGSVHVALAYRAGRPTDMVTVLTPTSRVMTRGGIIEVGGAPPSSDLSFIARVTEAFVRITGSKPSAATAATVSPEIVTILEGQARIEPLNSPDQSRLIDARSQARLVAGAVVGVIDLPPGKDRTMALAASVPQGTTPATITQLIVGRHVEHALEVERSLPKAAATGQKPDVTNPDLRGAVLPTSLGVPVTSPPAATANTSQSSIPIPTLSNPSPPPTVSSLAPSQSGGINTDKLLKDILRGDDDRGGRNRRRGERDD